MYAHAPGVAKCGRGQLPSARGDCGGLLPPPHRKKTTHQRLKTCSLPPRHLGVVCSSPFISTPRVRGWELAFTAPVVPALRLFYLICRPNWVDGWRPNFPLYFCFQKTLLALGEAEGAE